jgi:hypothetical protein
MAALTRHIIDTLVSDHQCGAALQLLTTFYPQSSNLGAAQFALDRVPELDLKAPAGRGRTRGQREEHQRHVTERRGSIN